MDELYKSLYKAESCSNSRANLLIKQNHYSENTNSPKENPDQNFEILNFFFQQINDLLKANDIPYLNQVIEQFILFLNFEETEVFEDEILFFFEESQIIHFLTQFLQANNEEFIVTILKLFISLSMISSDFIEIIISFFKDFEFFIVFIQHNINSNKIISYFLVLIGLISQYSEIYSQDLINSNFLPFCIDVLLDSHKFHVLNFIHKLILDISDEIDFEKSLSAFQKLFSQLKFIFKSKIQLHSSCESEFIPEVLEYDINISILILNIFKSCFLSPQIKSLFLSESIPHFILDLFYLFDSENVFFQKVISISIEIIEFSYDLIQNVDNISNISYFFKKVCEFLNYLSFEDKSLIIKSLVSIIFKSEDYIIGILDVEIFSTLIDFIESEIDYSNDIINLLMSLIGSN